MNRILFLVDGFNLYHSLTVTQYRKYKWLNIRKLCESFVSKQSKIIAIKYFTAYAPWRPDSYKRHQIYVNALKSVGINIVWGKFRHKDKRCPMCKQIFIAHEEKRTDVNIAITLLLNAMHDEFDTAMIISADSDLIPAIETVKTNFPNKRIGIIVPLGRKAKELKEISDFHMKIKEKHLNSCQFDDIISIGPNMQLHRPSVWK